MLSLLTVHSGSTGLCIFLWHVTVWIIHLILSICLLLSLFVFISIYICMLQLTLLVSDPWTISTLWILSPLEWSDAALAIGFSSWWKSLRVNRPQDKWQHKNMLPGLYSSCDDVIPGYFLNYYCTWHLFCNLKANICKYVVFSKTIRSVHINDHWLVLTYTAKVTHWLIHVT